MEWRANPGWERVVCAGKLGAGQVSMILAISRFRVANGMEAAVVEAFQQRPRLVDDELGFLGMEVFTDSVDPTVFHLVTRWTDAESYRVWHRSERHRQSHQWIPKGLRLDGSFTKVVILERLEGIGGPGESERTAFDAAPVLGSFLEASSSVCVVATDVDGRVTQANAAFAEALGVPIEEILGAPLWPHLVEGAADLLRERIRDEPRRPRERVLVHFRTAVDAPFTLSCQIDVQPEYVLLIGESPGTDNEAVSDMLRFSNDMAVMARESARQRRELEAARAELQATLDDLNESHWHLRKIQEVLPLCMDCGKVKTSDAKWESVVDYLKENSLFLSHGYCPDCMARQLEEQ